MTVKPGVPYDQRPCHLESNACACQRAQCDTKRGAYAGEQDAGEVLHRREEPEEEDGDEEHRHDGRHAVRTTIAFRGPCTKRMLSICSYHGNVRSGRTDVPCEQPENEANKRPEDTGEDTRSVRSVSISSTPSSASLSSLEYLISSIDIEGRLRHDQSPAHSQHLTHAHEERLEHTTVPSARR